jgi:hypothetical protein
VVTYRLYNLAPQVIEYDLVYAADAAIEVSAYDPEWVEELSTPQQDDDISRPANGTTSPAIDEAILEKNKVSKESWVQHCFNLWYEPGAVNKSFHHFRKMLSRFKDAVENFCAFREKSHCAVSLNTKKIFACAKKPMPLYWFNLQCAVGYISGGWRNLFLLPS